MDKKESPKLKEYIPLMEWGTTDYFKKPPPGGDDAIFNKDQAEWKDPLTGGNADGKAPNEFDNEDLILGKGIQYEHTDRDNVATKIAMDHLTEHPKYYNKKNGLPAMQKELQQKQKLNQDLDPSYTEEDGQINIGAFVNVWMRDDLSIDQAKEMIMHLLGELKIPVSDGKFYPHEQMVNSNLSENKAK